MHLYSLRKNIYRCAPYFETIATLIDKNFQTYTEISRLFYKNLHTIFLDGETKTKFMHDIRQSIFTSPIDRIQTSVDQFNKLKFKLQDMTGGKQKHAENLVDIQRIATEISEFLRHHLEICKYRKENFTDRETIQFIQKIDQIGIEWDLCLSKYLMNYKLTGRDRKLSDGHSLTLLCVLPETVQVNTALIRTVLDIVNFVFEITKELLKQKSKHAVPEIATMETGAHLFFNVSFEFRDTADVVGKFFRYLTVDNVKSEPLIVHALETTRIKIKSGITAAAMKTRAKKLMGHLKKLPDGAYFRLEDQIRTEDAMIISELCSTIERSGTPRKEESADTVTGNANPVEYKSPGVALPNQLHAEERQSRNQASAEKRNANTPTGESACPDVAPNHGVKNTNPPIPNRPSETRNEKYPETRDEKKVESQDGKPKNNPYKDRELMTFFTS